MKVSGQLQALAALPPGTNTSTHSMGGWVGPRVSLGILGESSLPLLRFRIIIIIIIIINPSEENFES
jgi:hypothetical protein